MLYLLKKKHLPAALYFLLFSSGLLANADSLVLSSKGMTVFFSKEGRITGICYRKQQQYKAVAAFTEIQSFVSRKDRVVQPAGNNRIRFEHQLYSDSLQQSCTLTETFTASGSGIRWQMEITGNAGPWSAAVKTIVQYPATAETRFWTSWGEPQFDSANCPPPLIASLSPYKNNTDKKAWKDPLVPVPFSNQVLYYGAPPFAYDDIKPGFIPEQGNLFALPFASVFEKSADAGLSVFLSPQDDIINLVMTTAASGNIVFQRLFNRIDSKHKTSFSLNLVLHENDWRSALHWYAARYPQYMFPPNAKAAMLGGTAAYSNFFDDFDAAKMKQMAFTVNWQASFDFPYMGMFLPPLQRTQQWTRLGGGTISMQQMDDYARRMQQKGFYVLSYFNVTEFGSWFKYPAPPADGNALWKDGSNYLATNFPDALLHVEDKVKITAALDSKTVHGGPYYSWKEAVATDCGDAAYQRFLLQQARRHIKEIPHSFGICIDRLDWLRFFNQRADDGKTWFDSRPARSLVNSWKDLMQQLGPLMHGAGKYILVNNHYKRIDLLQHADGILDEFTNATSPLNTTAFLTLDKPALGWTPGREVIEAAGGDNFFQKYLYLGVFPMCPFPGNDHALQPDSVVDRLYLDYGPLMNQLKEKHWVLTPGIVRVNDGKAKCNLFSTKNGYAIPVVYADAATVTVVLTDPLFVNSNFRYRAWQPGKKDPVTLRFSRHSGSVLIDVPVIRGAAMVVISK